MNYYWSDPPSLELQQDSKLLEKTKHLMEEASKAERMKAANELKKSKLKKEQSWAPYSLEDLKEILIVLPEDSNLYKKTDRRIKYKERSEAANELKKSKSKKIPARLQYSLDDLCQILIFLEQEFPQSSELVVKTKNRISCIEGRIEAANRLKVPKPDERCYFSDLTEEQLMSSFGKVRKFRFVLCKVFLSYKSVDAKDRRVYKRHLSTEYAYDLPNDTAHGMDVGRGHNLFGSIQAAGFSLDPASPPTNIFNRRFNVPLAVPKLGCLSPHFCYCSIPFSTSVKIAAELYVTTDDMVDMNTIDEYYSCFRGAPEQFNDAFEICNDSAVINFSDYFANRPNGGSCSYTLNGRDGYLKLYYVALKYVVDAALEVVFHATSKETKVAGRVMAYYGKHFDYGCSPTEVDDYKAMLFESKQPEVKPGKINLMQSVLSVPAQFSLIIDANLTDSTSGAIILSGVYEFFVPTDGSIIVGRIKGNDCALELKVEWKLPPFSEETIPSERSYYSDLTKKQEEDGRWSLQTEISLAFGCPVNARFTGLIPKVSVGISTGTEADGCDYLCTSVLNIWPEIRTLPCIDGPKLVGLGIKESIGFFPQAGMLEKCVVGGPGFLKFKLSGTWIAESILKMVEGSILSWAPKLPIKSAIIHILPRNIAKEMHMGHLQSAIIGGALAGVLAYSGVKVRQRFHYGDYLDNESKMMMTQFLIDRPPSGEVNDQAIGELEVLYEESQKKFVKDAEFRERTQPVQDWDKMHISAWEQICKTSRERYREVYLRLGIRVKEEGKKLHDYYIGETRKLLREKGYNTESEGDEVIAIEGRKLRLVDFAALWHSLEIGKADRIVHVADVGQRDKIEMCITAAERVGWTITNHCHDPLSHVGFVQVEGFKGIGLVQLLDEAKSRCKAVLVGKGKEVEHKLEHELEQTAKALGYGAVKYEVLKNSRLTDYTFNFDDMLKETGNTAVYLQKTHARICSSFWKSENLSAIVEKLEFAALNDGLTLKDDRERQLGLHLLRYTEVVGDVCRVLAPHILCDYLFALCEKFNGLYPDSGKVLLSDDASKILLFEATRVVIGSGLLCLEIDPIYQI